MFFFPPAGILDIVDEDPQRNPLKASPLYEMKSHCFKPKRSCRGFLWLGSPSTELHWVRKEESIQQNEVLRLRINGTTWPLKKKNETKQGNLFYSLPLLFFFFSQLLPPLSSVPSTLGLGLKADLHLLYVLISQECYE